MIDRFFTITFTVKRMVWYDESSELEDAISFPGHIQQGSMELAESLGLAFTRTFTLWCKPTVSLAIGDQIASGGKYYSVKAINVRDQVGVNKHIEAVIEQTTNFEE